MRVRDEGGTTRVTAEGQGHMPGPWGPAVRRQREDRERGSRNTKRGGEGGD